jgi:hypothetical protein
LTREAELGAGTGIGIIAADTIPPRRSATSVLVAAVAITLVSLGVGGLAWSRPDNASAKAAQPGLVGPVLASVPDPTGSASLPSSTSADAEVINLDEASTAPTTAPPSQPAARWRGRARETATPDANAAAPPAGNQPRRRTKEELGF